LKKDITIGEKYGRAMQITDQAEANAYLEECIQHNMSFGNTRKEAEVIEHQNIGYYSGYYDSETSARVRKLFKTEDMDINNVSKYKYTLNYNPKMWIPVNLDNID
jgi:hypothetical protein